jgi:putative pyruvate formate lyase activating enzyme
MASQSEPSSLALHRSGALAERVHEALALLGAPCRVCPRLCSVDRSKDERGLCRIGRRAMVASYFPHFGEEDCLRGWRGSGTIFFSGCNLRCVFCLPPETLVATAEGPRPIHDIFEAATDEIALDDGAVRRAAGVRVYTVTGELAPVSKAFRRPHRGELVRPKAANAPMLRLTPNHEVFAAHRSDPDHVVKVAAGSLTHDHYLVVPNQAALAEGIDLEVDAVLAEHVSAAVRAPRRRVTEDALVPALAAPRTSCDRLNGTVRSSERARWRDAGTHFLVPIHSLEREPYEGDVYNLEVDHPTHSYLAPAVAVANCQNFDVSWKVQGEEVSRERLAGMMLELQAHGCHNINWVTPEHVVPQILEALPLALDQGLKLPIVYNTSSYDSPDSLRLMEGVVDVFMPDIKLWTREHARRYLGKREYADVMRANVKEMHRQVGDLVLDDRGLARRGLIVRHLVMPGLLDETEAILRFVADEIGPDTYVNLMGQYYPAGRTDKFEEIDRRPRRDELERAFEIADGLGLKRLDPRSRRQALAAA